MNPLKVISTRNGNILDVRLEGSIGDDSDFPQLECDGTNQIHLNLGKVNYINSGGVRKWYVWITDLKNKSPEKGLVHSEVPPVLTKQIATIDSFIPKTSKVKSLFVPFFCDACSTNTLKLLQDVDRKQATEIIASMTCPACGEPVEVDGIPEHFLGVIERYR